MYSGHFTGCRNRPLHAELIHALTAIDQHNQYRLFAAKGIGRYANYHFLPDTDNTLFRPAPIGDAGFTDLWYRARLPLAVQWVTGGLDLFIHLILCCRRYAAKLRY